MPRTAQSRLATRMARTVPQVTNGGNRGPRYPPVMRGWKNSPQPVAQNEWISQLDAAQRLNVNVFRVGWALTCEILDPADSPTGEAGVTLASVDREILWRANATWGQRVRRGIRSTVRWF